ncbi:MAG: 5'/3'-nucleotidase SurE [Spirochaetaceae bacterium]|nr:MAG: 5'/3'-nucleotidase SurE [Spirochaetaceae bacterium]
MSSNDSGRAAGQPNILVTNDDGIDSPGLVAAIAAVSGLGRITVVAPTTQQSARGRSLQGDRSDCLHPVRLDGVDASVAAYHINASPALVVRHALMVLFAGDRQPDLIVSGINYGENLGNNITISGTVGAAFQGAAQGIPGIAVSRQTAIRHHFRYGVLDWQDAIRVTREHTVRLLQVIHSGAGLPFDVLKIDIPDPCPPGTEQRLTVLSRQAYYLPVYRDPQPDSPIRAAATIIDADAALLDPADDIYAVAIDRVVSITPLTLDCTAPFSESARVLGIAVPLSSR